MLASGATIEGYTECVRQKLASERYGRIHVQYNEDLASDVTIESGLAAGTKVKYMLDFDGENYIQWWISGRDVDLFQTVLVDDDSDSTNGYHHGFSTARPLPAGEYLVHYLYHSKDWEPCNYKPEDIYELWTVTVASPGKTVDEFLFDPAVVGTAVGVNSPSESVRSLLWESGKVKLVGIFGNHRIDVIELDGTVSLSLVTADVVPADGVLSWDVAEQSWETGDKLLIRISKGPNLPPR